MGKQTHAVTSVRGQLRPHLIPLRPQCDTGPAWCDPKTCQKQFSGPGSSCAYPPPSAPSNSTVPSSNTSASTTNSSYVSTVPNIDVCGHAVGGVSCPGAGVPPSPHVPGYFYRCCSSGGHCGPKNNIQSQDLYCGAGTCQVGFGDCATNRTPPPLPSVPPKTVGMDQTCGPIVNAKCGDGLCCSGSNFCGKSTTPSPHDEQIKKNERKYKTSPARIQKKKNTLTKRTQNRQYPRILRSSQLVPAALGQLQRTLTKHLHDKSKPKSLPSSVLFLTCI